MSSEVQSVLRAFAVLRTLAAHSSPLPLAAIAGETQLPKSTISRLLTTLVSIAMVERGQEPGTYTLGPGVHAFTGPPTSTAQLIAAAHPYLADLVKTYGEDAGLAVPDGENVLFAHQILSPNPVQVQNWTGTRSPAHVVASGHVMMAAWTDEEFQAYLARPLAQATERTVTDAEQLRERVRAARRQGYAWVFGEWVEGINGVAAPICKADGTPVGAINLNGPAYRFPGDIDAAVLGRDVLATARLVARHLTFD